MPLYGSRSGSPSWRSFAWRRWRLGVGSQAWCIVGRDIGRSYSTKSSMNLSKNRQQSENAISASRVGGGDQAAAGFEPHPRLEQRVMVMVMVMVIELAMVEAVLMKRGLERGSIRRRIERGAERVLETGVEMTSA